MLIKNKNVYNPKSQQELAEEHLNSLQEIDETELQSPLQETVEDKIARKDGDFISSD
jgi:hypothetical protein